MGTLNAMVSYLDFILCVEKALPDHFLGAPPAGIQKTDG